MVIEWDSGLYEIDVIEPSISVQNQALMEEFYSKALPLEGKGKVLQEL